MKFKCYNHYYLLKLSYLSHTHTSQSSCLHFSFESPSPKSKYTTVESAGPLLFNMAPASPEYAVICSRLGMRMETPQLLAWTNLDILVLYTYIVRVPS